MADDAAAASVRAGPCTAAPARPSSAGCKETILWSPLHHTRRAAATQTSNFRWEKEGGRGHRLLPFSLRQPCLPSFPASPATERTPKSTKKRHPAASPFPSQPWSSSRGGGEGREEIIPFMSLSPSPPPPLTRPCKDFANLRGGKFRG